jgi:lambda repressor-like predicted transcriptional regulator
MKLNTKAIRARIKERGLTIEQAATLMGMSRQNLQAILKNESTKLGRVEVIALPLGFDPKEILMEEKDESDT